MDIIVSRSFNSFVKKLHRNQKSDLDTAVQAIKENLSIGELKKGDLNGTHVYKFRMQKQLMLLAYHYIESDDTLYLIMAGSHENFYRDIKH